MAQSSPIGFGGSEDRPRMHPRRPVDLDHLARQTSGDPQVEREALQLFVVQSRLYLQRLRVAIGERERLDTAHSLKGSAAAVGAWGVAEFSEQLEQLVARGSERGIRDLLGELESEIDEICGFVGRLYTEH